MYSFAYTLLASLNAYVLPKDSQLDVPILSDGPVGTILSLAATILGLVFTITSTILDPVVMLSDGSEITSLYTMDIAFTYIPVALKALAKNAKD